MPAIMLQGTGSDVGKSLLVAGLCRAFVRRGLKVLPFKPQNMSNNAAVTVDGGEIGRAQALQARACGVDPVTDMNPVLLKPQSLVGAQVVVQGRVVGQAAARAFQDWKPRLAAAVSESFTRLEAACDLVIVEGAGSAAEVNLRANDIANMGFARRHQVPVILAGDIDRGGVIAQIVGTKAVLDPDDAALVKGFLVNKFRGDPSLFAAGMELIADRTGWPGLGLVPFFPAAARLPAEDAMTLDARSRRAGDGAVTVAVLKLPHIANFDDLDPLIAEPGIRVVWVHPGEVVQADAVLVLIPGSKTTIADLDALVAEGWDTDIRAHLRRGGRVLGICGGYQMLGRIVADPDGIEGPPGSRPGLGLLDVDTVLSGTKRLEHVAGVSLPDDVPVSGYEMHMGVTIGPDTARPLFRFPDGHTDGARSPSGHVRGGYVHGLFATDAQRRALLDWIGASGSDLDYDRQVEDTLDALAAHLEEHVDIDRIAVLAGCRPHPPGG